MALDGAVRRTSLVGRADDLDALVDLAYRADGGRAGALLVTGEAGVGKTALLREGCRQVSDTADVLWAPCLPLTSLAVPFLPLMSALKEWAAEHGVATPALSQAKGRADGDAAVRVRRVARPDEPATARRVGGRRPALGRPSSLDALMYVIAGAA